MLQPSALTASLFFFFNDPTTTEIYTLSLHDALPIFTALDLNRGEKVWTSPNGDGPRNHPAIAHLKLGPSPFGRSEEHTSELQSQSNLVCRLLLEKKKINNILIVFFHVLTSW